MADSGKELNEKMKNDKEEKRKKLEELRRKKKEREDKKMQLEGDSGRNRPSASSPSIVPPASPTKDPIQLSPVRTQSTPVLDQARAKPTDLNMENNVGQIAIPPRPPVVTYEREIQVETAEKIRDDENEVLPEPSVEKRGGAIRKASVATAFKGLISRGLEQVKNLEASPTKQLPPEEIEKITSSSDFGEFLNESTRIVERAMGQKFDVMKNFIQESDDIENSEKGKIKSQIKFYEDSYCRERLVSDLQWSPVHEELLMASYYNVRGDAIGQPNGVVHLWSLNMEQRPEFTFTCQSGVMSTAFNKFDNNLIIGGTYSGQIMVWDLRMKQSPVQRSLISESHSHPVYSLNVIGSQHANNIVSASNDGKICVWSLNMFTSPHISFEVRNRFSQISGQCVAFPENETNTFFMGSEDGLIVQSQLHNAKHAEGNLETIEAHYGPVTGLDIHPQGDQMYSTEAGNLMLSSSVDWTVKLWNWKSLNKDPICSLEVWEDYVYDVKWSYLYPSLFAVVDGDGNLDLWDLNKSSESPDVRSKVSNCSLNKVAWSPLGARLATGSLDGYVEVFSHDKERERELNFRF